MSGSSFDPTERLSETVESTQRLAATQGIKTRSKELQQRITDASNLTARTRQELLNEIKKLEGENFDSANLAGFNEGAQDLTKRLKQAIDGEGIFGSRQGIRKNVKTRNEFLGRRQTVLTRGEGLTSASANTLTGR